MLYVKMPFANILSDSNESMIKNSVYMSLCHKQC